MNAEGGILDRAGLDADTVRRMIVAALDGIDDGELFAERVSTETLVFDSGRLRSASYDTRQGFGLRAMAGEAAASAHSGDLSEAAIRQAAATVSAVRRGHGGRSFAAMPAGGNRLYEDGDVLAQSDLAGRIRLLEAIDRHVRAADSRVRQVSVALLSSDQAVEILGLDGGFAEDRRPLVRLTVTVTVGSGDRLQQGLCGLGGRYGLSAILGAAAWRPVADAALRQALVNLDAAPAPAGVFDVVLGPGWTGMLLHEAVGHGLEGDFNRKRQSAFSGLMGERVAAPGVTVVDDGTVARERGSLNVDDEGTPTQPTVLIEDGILVGYMLDRRNARLTGGRSTGNGRRQSYAHDPMPRMTNTTMRAGQRDPGEIIASVKDGIYAVAFGGGSVDIISGKYVFECTEAYRIRNGRVEEPVRGAMMIGSGPTDLKRIAMVGNDMALSPGIWTCGKLGQLVPVGIGQPTVRINDMVFGGSRV